jgi:predicted metal-binding protein
MSLLSPRAVREIPAKWEDVLLVCSKCEKKLGGGFGKKGSSRLEKVLGKAFKQRKRKVKILSVSCLKVCPKNAVTVVKGSNSGRAYLVYAGTDADTALGELGWVGGSIAG